MITHNQMPNIIKNNSYIMNAVATTMFGFANTEDEAKMMNLGRGFTQAYIFNTNNNVFWYKQIDQNGQIVVFKTFEYTESIPPEPEKPVSHDDLANMENRILQQIASMLQPNKEDKICG